MATGTGMPTGDEALLHDLCDDTVGGTARLHRRYGPAVAFPKGSQQTVFVAGPAAARDLFADPDTFHIYGAPGPRNSAQRRYALGLFGLNGPKQVEHRRLLMPPLSRPAVEARAGEMEALVDRTLAGWRIGRTVDLAAEMRQLALGVTGRLLFGLEDFSDAAAVAGAIQGYLDDLVRVVLAQTLPIELSVERYQDWLAAGDRLEIRLRHLIQTRRETLVDGQDDLMAHLLRAEAAGRLTDGEVVGEVQTLLNAAYQTTAAALTWTLLLLAQHPAVARAALAGAGPDPAGGPGVERAVKESLRLLPPVAIVSRRVARPGVVMGHPVPTGSVVVLSVYVTHHLPESFPDPERFDPGRWVGPGPGPYAYVPFGSGARMCMGAAFAMRLFRVAVPAVLRRFRLAFAPGTRVDRHSTLTLNVRGALPVTLLPPDGPDVVVPLTGTIHEMVRLPGAGAAPAKAA
ncbi:MAG: hypothetical protein C0501_29575 [Isosphaera sp.]|nr:hypothetical protein [Isosphaera sp.]